MADREYRLKRYQRKENKVFFTAERFITAFPVIHISVDDWELLDCPEYIDVKVSPSDA
jgi:hypothetical protein